MEKQRSAKAAAVTKTLECGCPDSTCADGNACAHPLRRISAAKPDSSNMVRNMLFKQIDVELRKTQCLVSDFGNYCHFILV